MAQNDSPNRRRVRTPPGGMTAKGDNTSLSSRTVTAARQARSLSVVDRHAAGNRRAAELVLAELPHVLVGWAGDPRSDPVSIALARIARVTFVDVAAHSQRREHLAERPIDVLVLSAAFVGASAQPLLSNPVFGLPESVFVVDHDWSPERFVLESMGFRYVVTRRDLTVWLPSVVSRLCELSRARRMAHEAVLSRPPPPDPPGAAPLLQDLPLHVAETRFREAYLRLLLARHGSRRRAAEHARVPYRSFCAMLRKLGM